MNLEAFEIEVFSKSIHVLPPSSDTLTTHLSLLPLSPISLVYHL